MSIHQKTAIDAEEKEFSEKVSAVVAALSGREVSGAELNKRPSRYQSAYPESAIYCEPNSSEVRKSVDYLVAPLRELRRKYGK